VRRPRFVERHDSCALDTSPRAVSGRRERITEQVFMEREESRPLDAQLEQVQASLEESLDEACGVDVKRLDTGQSMRMEKVLATASEAARKVVSIRRTRDKLASSRAPADTPPPPAEHREFVDQRGVTWDAFAVLPTADPRSLARLPEQYQHGWLCFESATEKRRLGPIPEHWQTVTDEELRRFRDSAQPVQHRAAPPEPRDGV
jgi:hypothetical protein